MTYRFPPRVRADTRGRLLISSWPRRTKETFAFTALTAHDQ